jgi:uncharacterized membrane protein YkvA (DUF1232 family)
MARLGIRIEAPSLCHLPCFKGPACSVVRKSFWRAGNAYAFSPIDLIPDFIPVLGYLDDLILLPIGIAVTIKLIPKEIMRECLEKASSDLSKKKHKNWIAGAIVILIWISILTAVAAAVIAGIRVRR